MDKYFSIKNEDLNNFSNYEGKKYIISDFSLKLKHNIYFAKYVKIFEILNEKFNWILIDVQNLNEINKIKNSVIYILVLKNYLNIINNLKLNNNYILSCSMDLHYPENQFEIMKKISFLSNLNIGFTTYLYKELNYSTENLLYYPTFLEKSNIKFNNNPSNKICLSGYIYPKLYPLRSKIAYFYKEHPNVEILNHPGYKKLQHNIIGDNYIKHLSNYIACISTGSKFRYFLSKNLEICQAGSLLLVDDNLKDVLELNGFFDFQNCILFNQSNIDEKINYILDEKNREKVDEIRLNGKNHVDKYHMIEERANYINSKISEHLNTIKIKNVN